MHVSEVLTILCNFHFSGYRDFKRYFDNEISIKLATAFPNLVSYSRFIELEGESIDYLTEYLDDNIKEQELNGNFYIDTTIIFVCNVKRIFNHKVFKDAARTRIRNEWFYGFKLHFVINDKGEIIRYLITPANKHDISVLEELTAGLKGKIAGDKAYFSNPIKEKLKNNGLRLITYDKKNFKSNNLSEEDKIFLKGRNIIETIFGILKYPMNLQHTRHRSPINFKCNIFSCLIAYSFSKYPSIA